MTVLLSVLIFGGLLVSLGLVLIVAERFLVNYGQCQIDINAGEKTFEVEGGQTLLSALYEKKVFIPSACGGKGTCGHCKITVKAGGGAVLATELPYLSRKEVRQGLRLACQVKVRQSLQVRIPEELLNVQRFTARVASARHVTHDTKEILFELIDPAEIPHRPGQYVQIEAPSPEGPVYRAYSISSPTYKPNVVELIVRLVPGGVASTYLHNLQVGDEAAFTGPYGEFRLNEDPDTELVCVGGGCGMAPMKNIIYSVFDRWPDRPLWLFFGARTTVDVFYLEQFEELARKHPSFRVIYALSDELSPDEKWDGETGFIHLSADKHLEPDRKRQAFLCGPEPMIDAVTVVLKDKGLADHDIFYDKF